MSVGASLTAETTRLAWAVPVENAVEPPLVVVSAVARVELVDAAVVLLVVVGFLHFLPVAVVVLAF